MKNLSIQVFIMGVVTAIAGFVAITPAKAQAAVLQIETQTPPPPQQNQRWASPYHSSGN